MRNIDISKKKFVVFILVLLFLSACKKENQNQNNTNHNNSTYETIENSYGFGLLKKIPKNKINLTSVKLSFLFQLLLP